MILPSIKLSEAHIRTARDVSIAFDLELQTLSLIPVYLGSKLSVSHGLVVSGANFLYTPTDPHLPDVERNQKMMFSSCSFHVVFMSS